MLLLKDLKTLLELNGFQPFRAKQILHAVFKEGKQSFEEINVLPKDLREFLSSNIKIQSLESKTEQISKDKKTIKVLFLTQDDHLLEAVLMNFDDGRATICVSSQIGCQLGCKFCSTGKMGFTRNLSSEEISDQVLYFHQRLAKKNKRISNIVFMGMGEPFMNYDNVMSAIRNLNDKDTFNIGARSITVSTSGIVDGIEKLAEENIQVNLAISLHSPTQELRERIMPIAKKYDLNQLMEAVRRYIDQTNRRITYEYIMLKGVNDSPAHAEQLSLLVKDQLCHINLIPYNTADTEGFTKSSKHAIETFRDILEKHGIVVTIRRSLGDDIAAACGQLANK